MQPILLCISVGAAYLLSAAYSRSEPYDRFSLDLIVSLAISAGVLWFVQYTNPSLLSKNAEGNEDPYNPIPLSDVADTSSTSLAERRKSSVDLGFSRLDTKRQFWLISSAIIALTIRVELHRKILAVAQCSSRSPQVLIPLVLAINEGRHLTRAGSLRDEDHSSAEPHGFISKSVLRVSRTRWRYIPSALAVAYGGTTVTSLWQTPSSTFICPIISGEAILVPRMQILVFMLDCFLAVIVDGVVRSNDLSRSKVISLQSFTTFVLLGAVLCWTTYTTFVYNLKWEEMEWLITNDAIPTYKPVVLMIGQGLLLSILVISSIYCVQRTSVYQYSITMMALILISFGVNALWSSHIPYPPTTASASLWPFVFLFSGLWSSYCIGHGSGYTQTLRLSVFQIMSFILLLVLVVPRLRNTTNVDFHPIENLMFEAKVQHEAYTKRATQSVNLQSAVATYRDRYHQEPPPGFDKWYEYASKRSVLVIDEYDQIYKDLRPFRAVAPAIIRKQTWEAVSNPWNEISGITIRNGKADVQENVIPTHRWMLEGVAILINTFAEYLPDMDLAFNLNDESRVAVPHDRMGDLLTAAANVRFSGRSSWSSNRASTWEPVAKEEYKQTVFENLSFQKNFQRFGTIGCAPTSLSRTQPHLSSQAQLCIACLQPHSLEQFVANWTLAADMCHQPDMSHLHGFYLSPAAFKTTYELMPIFSQSKASGYNDVLYPSSWNYMDKVSYRPVNASGEHGSDTYSAGYPDPPFSQKSNTLYWRGATSEGVSGGTHAWRGMTRQRLIHLANNATSNSKHDHTTILLPSHTNPDKYTYYDLPGSALLALGLQNKTDIKIAPNIVRCGGADCSDQEREFGLVTPVDFQTHWKYKFLFDMDGAGFSGRFLPFLQSHSLPFKTALFREWYDSRITAWRHFVPMDLRLHGVWSTLAYFAGIDGVWPNTGKKYTWEPHTMQAETIAEEGRKWAGQVLRKEDMEVYFFRLLLEWGRLTDDRRDELGFSIT